MNTASIFQLRLYLLRYWSCLIRLQSKKWYYFFFFFFSSRRRHTRCREVSWARRCVQETDAEYMGIIYIKYFFSWLSRKNEDIESKQSQRLLLLRHFIWIYSCLLAAICIGSVSRLLWPAVDSMFLSKETAVISYIVFCRESAETARSRPKQYCFKALAYWLNGCALIAANVKPFLALCLAGFSFLQLFTVRRIIVNKFKQVSSERVSFFNSSASPKKNSGGMITAGAIGVGFNILILAIIIGKGWLFLISKDGLQLLIAGAAILLYFRVIFQARIEKFILNADLHRSPASLYHAFTLVQPIGASLFSKLKSLKKMKFKWD
eukprot:TRINITY_DN11169_c0_g1_i4.p1 TRINITY_DN11169_c0_g1~~TRINITY_DN11169_c0_g1_i4.p1  ORF type:complete len:321 (-),score=37.17 TRINITY_DN11169_c0_g1_i4:37-999(-)